MSIWNCSVSRSHPFFFHFVAGFYSFSLLLVRITDFRAYQTCIREPLDWIYSICSHSVRWFFWFLLLLLLYVVGCPSAAWCKRPATTFFPFGPISWFLWNDGKLIFHCDQNVVPSIDWRFTVETIGCVVCLTHCVCLRWCACVHCVWEIDPRRI